MWWLKYFTVCLIWQTVNVNALVEDVIDVLYLSREVIKTISSTWELADQVGVTNEIDLPFMKRKEKKILTRMVELSYEIKNTEMMVRLFLLYTVKLTLLSLTPTHTHSYEIAFHFKD